MVAPIVALPFLAARYGIPATKVFLKTPLGKKIGTKIAENFPKIADTVVGSGSVAYVVEKFGLDKLFSDLITGKDLENIPEEKRIEKKEERQKVLDEAKKNKAAAAQVKGQLDAANRGEYGYVNAMGNFDTGSGKVFAPSQEEIEKMRKEIEEYTKGTGTRLPVQEKFTGNVTTIPNIDDLINKPLIMAQDPDAGKANILSTPVLGPNDQLPTIYTMGKIKNEDLIYVGGNINTKLPKYLVDEKTNTLKKEYQKTGDEGEDADKLISQHGVYKLPKYMLDKKAFIRKNGKKDTDYTIKEQYKNPEELKRLKNSEKIKDVIVEYYNNNPDAYAVMKNKDITKLGSEEVKNLKQYVIDNHGIDFGIKTYEKILRETFGSRKKEGIRLQPQNDAIRKFQTIIRDYSKEKFGETLTNPQVDRYIQEFRIAIKTENPDKKKGEYYTNEQITGSANFVIDTVFKGKNREKFDIGYDRDLTSYIQNKLERTAQTKEKFETNPEAYNTNIQTIGHYGTMKERLVGEGGDESFYATQSLAKNTLQQNLDTAHKTARKNNDIEKMKKIEQEMKDNDIRSMYTDKDENRIFIGADAETGKYKDGGIVGIDNLTRSLRNF